MSDGLDKSLLKWAIQNSHDEQDAAKEQAQDNKQVTPESLQEKANFLRSALGPSDEEKMVLSVECITDPTASLENILIALDNLELLVESIDNACNIEKLHLWPSLIEKINDTSIEKSILIGILWVIGTAAQNNKEVKDQLIKKYALLPLLIRLTKIDDIQVTKKCMYCLSSILNQDKEGLDQFKELGGAELLNSLLNHKELTDRANYMIESFEL